ncbi:MAG: crossover junction endodeoxyribonuclease RuvC [candidate division Zixibacteria bacterium]|nr:crossover junction endodeoxyribonuclease RuvC [candidate division Zixibacteria bacterium]MDD5425105.1 crossover junction endodeoxyribonuclease RuvC [candidate division Zixibacteria bacterium]
MRILGIDPGLHITGYGLLDIDDHNPKVIEAGVIRTTKQAALAEQLKEIASELDGIINQFKPDAIAVEELYSHYNHPRTAIIMGHARGIIFLKAAEAQINIFPYASTRIKKSLTGNGRAKKNQVQRMIKVLLGLRALPEPPDTADALAIALCHCRAMNYREGKESD